MQLRVKSEGLTLMASSEKLQEEKRSSQITAVKY